MLDTIYSLLIYPLTVVLELILDISFRVTDNYGISIILLSIIVNIFLLPLYYMADGWKNKNKQLLDRMQPEIDAIKRHYKGKERYFYIQTIYRRFNFHPLSSVKASIGFLIQIPFFIAAFQLLRSYSAFEGISFGLINDLSKPDGLIFGQNFLPFLMTVANLVSFYFYSKSMSQTEKYQFFALALVFFFVLYSKASGLLLYWTMNNVFSLFKNIVSKKFFKANKTTKETTANSSLLQKIYISIIPAKWQNSINSKMSKQIKTLSHMTVQLNSITLKGIIISSFMLFLFPTLSIIASSPHEFSDHSKLIGIMLYLFLFSIGILIFFARKLHNIPKILAFMSLFITLYFLTNAYVFSGNYGLMDFFTFQSSSTLAITSWNVAYDVLTFLVLGLLSFQMVRSNKILLIYVDRGLQVMMFMLLFSAISYSYSMTSTTKYYNDDFLVGKQEASFKPKFHFSKHGRNVLIIFFDRLMGGYVPDMFKDTPSLKNDLSGFTWYANTPSFGSETVTGLPPIYAGYKSTNVVAMQKTGYNYKRGYRSPGDKIMQDRFLPSTQFMLNKFLAKGYRTYITNPPFVDTQTINNLHKNSFCENLIGKYSDLYLKKHKLSFTHKKIAPEDLVIKYLIPFSLFKILPPSNRVGLYHRGSWWDSGQQTLLTSSKIRKYLNNLSLADAYPSISTVNNEMKGSYMFTTNYMAHEPYAALDNGEFLKLTPESGVRGEFYQHGKSNVINEETVIRFKDWWTTVHFFAAKEAFNRMAAWAKWMKENGVYDNTMVIIVSDHGAIAAHNPMFASSKGKMRRLGRYHPVFMVKGFHSTGNLKTDYSFMTTADVPSFALSAIDPQAKIKYGYDKSKGFRLYTPYGNLTVYNNIFNLDNWIYKN